MLVKTEDPIPNMMFIFWHCANEFDMAFSQLSLSNITEIPGSGKQDQDLHGPRVREWW